MSFLKFIDLSKDYPDRVTKMIEVQNQVGLSLGSIRWYSPWRRYCFYPVCNPLFDSACLGEIKTKIDELMQERKNDRTGSDRVRERSDQSGNS